MGMQVDIFKEIQCTEKSAAWTPREARGIAAKKRKSRTTTRPSDNHSLGNGLSWPERVEEKSAEECSAKE
jgi:hypothetical protein